MKKIITFSIIAVVLLLVVGGIFMIPETKQAVLGTCSGGTTILSIDRAFVTTSNDLSGKRSS